MESSPSTPLDVALQAEYYHLQKTIEDFDGRALTIKAWSVTFGLAALLGGFAGQARTAFLFAAAGAAMFWLLEAAWKLFQLGYYARVEQIERHFRGEAAIDVPHQISASWQSWWKSQSRQRLGRVALWPHVALPHVFVVVAGVVCYFTISSFGAG
jgi:uncharacterized membrane protein